MRVAMIGTGYVGLVSGACFSEFGHDVACIDLDGDKIAALTRGEMPIYEPGLDTLVAANLDAGRLSFATELEPAVAEADAVFIAVGTPGRRGDGQADVSYVLKAAKEIAEALDGPTTVVTKSTVPVGTGRRVRDLIAAARPEADFEIAANPEFLREGSALNDFMRPDRVIVGSETEQAREGMRDLYRPLFLLKTPVLFTTLETAELIKYAANTFLATKITFINEIADLCDKIGADVSDVARGIGLDGRIGAKFLHPGPGFGGSCFPKDTRALEVFAREVGAPSRIVEAVNAANDTRKKGMAAKIIEACGGSVNDKTVAVLGLTFKPNTDDMREAPSLDIVPALQEAGGRIRGYDPEGMEPARALLTGVDWCASAYEAMEGADALALLTEWNEFRALDLDRVKSLMKRPLMIDLRNVYDPAAMSAAGFEYISIGRPAVSPKP